MRFKQNHKHQLKFHQKNCRHPGTLQNDQNSRHKKFGSCSEKFLQQTFIIIHEKKTLQLIRNWVNDLDHKGQKTTQNIQLQTFRSWKELKNLPPSNNCQKQKIHHKKSLFKGFCLSKHKKDVVASFSQRFLIFSADFWSNMLSL
jgi:hypothetical protein